VIALFLYIPLWFYFAKQLKRPPLADILWFSCRIVERFISVLYVSLRTKHFWWTRFGDYGHGTAHGGVDGADFRHGKSN